MKTIAYLIVGLSGFLAFSSFADTQSDIEKQIRNYCVEAKPFVFYKAESEFTKKKLAAEVNVYNSICDSKLKPQGASDSKLPAANLMNLFAVDDSWRALSKLPGMRPDLADVSHIFENESLRIWIEIRAELYSGSGRIGSHLNPDKTSNVSQILKAFSDEAKLRNSNARRTELQ